MDAAQQQPGSEQQLIEELLDKKEKLNQQANRQRDLRDRLNDETRKHAQHRDELNGKVREFIEKANGHRAKRDEQNKKVQEAKKLRDELNKAANEKADAMNALKRTRSRPGDDLNLQRLKQEVRKLEYDQQTKVLTPKKEKELIDRMTDLSKQIRAKEKEFESDVGVRDAYLGMKDAKEKAEASHKAVTELANAAQEQHDTMVKLFEEADAIRKEADGAQEQFVKAKLEADKVHQEYIAMVNSIRDYEKQIIGLRNKMRADRGQAEIPEGKAEAEDIFAKFKKGEKLSTEDLMALQKAGLL
ncbi:MAG: hypothetical protein LC624_09090 [Halobacteriales archaeon]|nr:hypothetical protein [Halobacteriales archaeon]